MSSSSIGHENLRFPQKLKLMLDNHSDTITWGRHGTTVLINTTNLDEYLTNPSTNMLFDNILHFSSFERQLFKYGFSKITSSGRSKTPKSELHALTTPIIYEYRHHHFCVDKLDGTGDLLCEQVRPITSAQTMLGDKLLAHCRRRKFVRKRNDNCERFNRSSTLPSPLELARMRLRAILQTKLLKNRINRQMQMCMETNSYVIELPEDCFDNTTESVFEIKQNNYAGYYGKVSSDQIVKYFGAYLPIYSENSADNTNVIVKEKKPLATSSATVTSNTYQYQINYEIEPLSPINDNIAEDLVEDSCMTVGSTSTGTTFGDFTEIHYENEPMQATMQDDASNETIMTSEGSMQVDDQSNSSIYHREIDEMLTNLQNGQCENVVTDSMFKEIRESISLLYN